MAPQVFDVWEYAADTSFLGSAASNFEQDADGAATVISGSLLEIYSNGTWSITVP